MINREGLFIYTPIVRENAEKLNSIKLEDVSKTEKKRPWKVHKKNSRLLSESFDRIGKEKKAERVFHCGDLLTFSACPSGHEKRLKRASFCRVRLCPMCGWRRSLKVAGQVQKIAHIANEQHKIRWLFLTLTCQNVEGYELPDRLDNLTKSWKRLTELKAFKENVLGFFRSLEVTRNTDILSSSWNTYHPHFHAVLAIRPSYFKGHKYIKTEEWVQMWKKAMRVDYDPIVDIRTVRAKRNRIMEEKILKEKGIELKSESGREDYLPASAVAEVTKYTTKSGDYIDPKKPDETDEAVQILDVSLRGRRLYAFGGILKDIYEYLKKNGSIEDAEADDADLIHTDDDLQTCTCSVCGSSFREEIYRWLPDMKNYYLFSKF